MIALNCKIDENITGSDKFVLQGGFRFYKTDITNKKFYPSFQQNELTLIINLKNTGSTLTEIEIGIEENLSINNKIVLIKTSLQAGEVKTFQIKTDIFLRTLIQDVSNPTYYYGLYYNTTGNIEAKGIFSLSIKNKLYADVPY